MASNESQAAFKVIVAGGGIAGLAMSHALSKANIDHVVFEKHSDVVYPSGASIGLWPNSHRFLEQIGCLDDIQDICAPMHTSYNRLPDGSALMVSRLFDMIIDRHGYEFLLIERQRFIKVLYDNLPDKSKIVSGKEVTAIQESEQGVRVTLDDGTVEEGDIVIGADGVRSNVRSMMWENANKVAPGSITAAEKRGLTTSYKCLFGLAPAIPGSGTVGEMTVIHNDGFSFLVLTQPDRVFFFVFIRLPDSTRWPTSKRYTTEEANEEAARLADLPVNETLLFGELWKHRIRGHLVTLEEGIFDHWHFGRTALVGDAAHKMTPNVAFGANSALESVASLCNGLQRLAADHPDSKPSGEAISAIFQEYHESRLPRLKKIFDLSALMTRLQAWDGRWHKVAMRYIMPWVSDDRVADLFAEVIKGAVKLDYVPLSKSKSGADPWENDDDETRSAGTGEMTKKSKPVMLRRAAVVLLSVVALTSVRQAFLL